MVDMMSILSFNWRLRGWLIFWLQKQLGCLCPVRLEGWSPARKALAPPPALPAPPLAAQARERQRWLRGFGHEASADRGLDGIKDNQTLSRRTRNWSASRSAPGPGCRRSAWNYQLFSFPQLQKMMLTLMKSGIAGDDAEPSPCKHRLPPCGLIPVHILWLVCHSGCPGFSVQVPACHWRICRSHLWSYRNYPRVSHGRRTDWFLNWWKNFIPETLKKGNITFEHIFEEVHN